MTPHFTISNSFEIVLKSLSTHLQRPSDHLRRKIIICPNQFKMALKEKLSTHQGVHIFFGVEILEILPALSSIYSMVMKEPLNLPSLQQLQVALYYELSLSPSFSYMKEQEIVAFAEELAHLAIDISRYAPHAWQQLPSWTIDLLNRRFSKKPSLLPSLQLLEKLQQSSTSSEKIAVDIHIITTTLPPLFFNYFSSLSSRLWVGFYLWQPQDPLVELAKGEDARGIFLRETTKLVRKTAALAIEQGASFDEMDLISEKKVGSLQSVKELLSFDTPLSFNSPPPTIFCGSYSSVYEEVLSVYEALVSYSRKMDLSPQDVVIFTPSIETYFAPIASIFGAHPLFPVDIHSVDPRLLNPTLEILSRLMKAIQHPAGFEDLRQILLHPIVLQKHQVSSREMERVLGYCEKMGARYLFEKKGVSNRGNGSLQKAIERLIGSMLLEGSIPPLTELPLVDSIAAFEDAVRSFAYDSQTYTYEKWTDRFFDVCTHLIEKEELFTPFAELSTLHTSEELISQECFFHIVEQMLFKSSAVYSIGDGAAIRVFPLKPGIVVDCPLIILLGMDETKIPHRSPPPPQYAPALEDLPSKKEEQYLAVLEAIYAAQQSLWFSHVHTDEQDGLCRDRATIFSLFLRIAPSFSSIESLSDQHFYHPWNRKRGFCQKSGQNWLEAPPKKIEKTILSLSMIERFGKSPLRLYASVHEFFLYPKQEVSTLFDELSEGYFLKRELEMKALCSSPKEAWDEAARKGILPSGVGSEISFEALIRKITKAKEFLASFGSNGHLFTLFLTNHLPQSTQDDHLLRIKAAQYCYENQQYKVLGSITLCKEGLISLEKSSHERVLALTPLLCAIADVYDEIKPQILFLGDCTVKEIKPIPFQKWLEVIIDSQKKPTPFIPHLRLLLSKGICVEEAIETVYQQAGPIEQRFFQSISQSEIEQIERQWNEQWKDLAGGVV